MVDFDTSRTGDPMGLQVSSAHVSSAIYIYLGILPTVPVFLVNCDGGPLFCAVFTAIRTRRGLLPMQTGFTVLQLSHGVRTGRG